MRRKGRWLAWISLVVLVVAGWLVVSDQKSSYLGTDEIVSSFAEQLASRKARDPFINTDRGDMLLFVFAAGGFGAGFASGYLWRDLFGPAGKKLPPGEE